MLRLFEKSLLIKAQTEHLRSFTSGDIDSGFQMYCADEKLKKLSIME